MFIIALYSGIFIMAAAISYTINFCKQYLFFRFYTYLVTICGPSSKQKGELGANYCRP